MKKIWIIFFIGLVLFAACESKLYENYGTVVINLETLPQNARTVGADGLPEISGMTVEAKVIGRSSGTQEKTFSAPESKNWTLRLPIGEKFEIQVKASNESGIWKGKTYFTVSKGSNTVSVKLDKNAAGLKPLTFSLKREANDSFFTLNLGETEVFKGQTFGNGGDTPLPFCRDTKGRIYMGFLEEKGVSGHSLDKAFLYRWDSEGKNKQIKDLDNKEIKALTADMVTGAVYVCVVETGTHNWKFYTVNEADLTLSELTVTGGTVFHEISAIAAYGNQFFIFGSTGTSQSVVFVYDITDSGLAGEAQGLEHSVPDTTDMLVQDGKLYLIGKKQVLSYEEPMQSTGFLKIYNYDKAAKKLTEYKTLGETAVPSSPPENNMTETDADGFYGAVQFIGFEDDILYIADSGVVLAEKNECPRITGNVNRIAAYNTSKESLTFKNTTATWRMERPVWEEPSTKTLVWKKSNNNEFVYYWLKNAGDALPDEADIESDTHNRYSDIFCFDQDGNFYIVKKDGSSQYYVTYYKLLPDGSYDTTGIPKMLDVSFEPKAIAVDISGRIKDSGGHPLRVLYYYYADGPMGHICRYEWNGDGFNIIKSTSYDISVSDSAVDCSVTALAANKDGLFAAIKTVSPIGSTLTVQKYVHDGTKKESIEVFNGVTASDWSTLGDLNALSIKDGMLYALMTVRYQNDKDNATSVYKKESISGQLLKIGNSTADFTGSPQELYSSLDLKGLHSADDEKRKEGGKFAPYRFVAVMPKKLIIASDGFWGYAQTPAHPEDDTVEQFNFMWDFGINADGTLKHDKFDAGTETVFSKEVVTPRISGCGFEWQ